MAKSKIGKALVGVHERVRSREEAEYVLRKPGIHSSQKHHHAAHTLGNIAHQSAAHEALRSAGEHPHNLPKARSRKAQKIRTIARGRPGFKRNAKAMYALYKAARKK